MTPPRANPAASPAPPVGGPPVRPRPEPAERGKLHIAPLVVRRIAEHAADRTEGVARPGPRAKRSAARVRGGQDNLEIELDVWLVYPQPVRETAQRLRAAVTDEVARITGRTVRRVPVTVVALLPDVPPRVE